MRLYFGIPVAPTSIYSRIIGISVFSNFWPGDIPAHRFSSGILFHLSPRGATAHSGLIEGFPCRSTAAFWRCGCLLSQPFAQWSHTAAGGQFSRAACPCQWPIHADFGISATANWRFLALVPRRPCQRCAFSSPSAEPRPDISSYFAFLATTLRDVMMMDFTPPRPIISDASLQRCRLNDAHGFDSYRALPRYRLIPRQLPSG